MAVIGDLCDHIKPVQRRFLPMISREVSPTDITTSIRGNTYEAVVRSPRRGTVPVDDLTVPVTVRRVIR